MFRPIRPLATAAALTGVVALGVLALPAPAAFAAAPKVTTLSTAFVNPVQLAVQGSTVLVTDRNGLYRVGTTKALAVGPSGGEVSGVAFGPGGSYAYASSTANRATTRLTIVTPGKPTVTADLSGFEKKDNPDGRVLYGVPSPSACVRNAFKQLDGGPANYLGKVVSHPVAVANAGSSWYVADAGGNDILRVTAAGVVSRVVVLPRVAFVFTSRLVAGLGLPSCVVGAKYYAEAVPTDVETRSDGSMWVTTQEGLYDLGQLGFLYRIDPKTHAIVRQAIGLAGAANVAITSTGAVYVTELLRGRVSRIRAGKPVAYLSLANASGLEAVGTRLYASALAPVVNGIRTGPGRVVRIG